jgi:hypothetical protein
MVTSTVPLSKVGAKLPISEAESAACKNRTNNLNNKSQFFLLLHHGIAMDIIHLLLIYVINVYLFKNINLLENVKTVSALMPRIS